MSATQRVRFSGGPLSGAVIECPETTDLAKMNITITQAGVVYDRGRERRVPGATVVELPLSQRPAPTPEPQPVKTPRRRRKTPASA